MYWHILTKYPLLLFVYYVLRFFLLCINLVHGSIQGRSETPLNQAFEGFKFMTIANASDIF